MRKSHRTREPCFTTEPTDTINKTYDCISGGKKYGAKTFKPVPEI